MNDQTSHEDRDTTARQALQRHSQLAKELASLHQERGELLSATSEVKVSAYDQAMLDGANVTNARHAADVASINFEKELHKINAAIAAAETEVHYIGQLLAYLRSQNARECNLHHD